MAIIELNINKNMLDLKFEGYKLSLDPMPVLKHPIPDGINYAELLSNEEFSYLHVRMSVLLNRLFQDSWNHNSVFYINNKNCVQWNSLQQDGRLSPSRLVWKVPTEESKMYVNATLYFPCLDWCVLCNGSDSIYLLHTPSRAAGEPWTNCHQHSLSGSSQYYIQHAVHREIPNGHQIDCLVASTVVKSSVEAIAQEIKDSEKSFIVLLEWISFTCGPDEVWTEKRTRKLIGSSVPEYAAIDSSFDAICLASESEYKVIFDSEKPVGVLKKTEKQEPVPPLYTFMQTCEDITIYFRLSEDIGKSDIGVKFLPSYIEVYLRGQSVLKGQLENIIDTTASTWILDDQKLVLTLTKTESGLMWQKLIKGCVRGKELMDPVLVDEIHSQLAHLTSETEVVQNSRSTFNMEQLEECDDSAEFLIFQRIDGNTYNDTHRVNMGGHQWLFMQQTCPEKLPAICLRHDVDGILWQPKNVLSEGEEDHFKIEHTVTFNALGYVQASKQDKKLILCSPDFHYSVISDCSRHLYIYSQPENLNSALQLRNRKTGESISHIAKQYVVSLEQCDKILGMQVSSQCIFVLSKDMLYVVKFF